MFDRKIEEMIEQVQKPARYIGGEMNTAVKAWEDAEVHFAFCFPDTYEVAMSHLGMKILYAIINAQPWALCERVCMPWIDMKELMEQNGVPLFSLESRTPLNQFDLVGFTLQYEMSYTNILTMLKLGGVPLHTAERGMNDPIVCVGGPCAFKPRVECLKALAKIEGVYVPSFYDVTYHEDGTIASFTPNCPEAPAIVRKRILLDMDKAFYPTEIPVPYTEIVHDRIMLEIMRGCTRGCRFCEAGMLYRPVRERSVPHLMELARALEKSTGYEEISLSSLSSGDYSCLPELVHDLMTEFKEKRVSVSLPSLRIDSVLKDSLEETQQVKKSSLTFAPEAGTQRLRDVINKGVTEEDLVGKVTDAFEGGWSSVKLYFMTGLPTETLEDLDGIGHLAQVVNQAYFKVPKEKRARGLRVTCSASSFVPKPFTPFQWEPQNTQQQIKDKQAYLRDVLRRIKGVNFNWHEPEVSYLEACFSRGDRRIGRVLERAVEKGCLLDGWSEQFKFDKWMEAFADCGLDPEWYAYRRRGKDEILPWDFIDAGVTKSFLWREKERAERAEVTPDCRKGCQGCGLRRFEGVCRE